MTTQPAHPSVATLTETGALPAGLRFTDNGDGTATLAGTHAAGTGGSLPGHGHRAQRRGRRRDPVRHAHRERGAGRDQRRPPRRTRRRRDGVHGHHPRLPHPDAGQRTEHCRPASRFTDNGDGTATLAGTPAAGTAGSYPLDLVAANSVGTAADQPFTVTVGRLPQAITVTSADPGTATVGGSYVPAATADSGLPVGYGIDPATTAAACSFDGGTVSFDHAGTCVVAFTQPGDADHAPAVPVQVSIAVAASATTTTLTASAIQVVYGQQLTATAGVPAAGSVQFAVDGIDAGAPVTVVGGRATSGALADAGHPLARGAHSITAVFVPADPTRVAASSAQTTLTVAQAATGTRVAVRADAVTAGVAPVAPGAGSPGGTVAFSVDGVAAGTAPLVDGVAVLDRRVAPGAPHVVTAVYGGDTDFAGSSASTSRHDPRITATLGSPLPRSRYGWYRAPVVVTFHCATDGAPLNAPCPAPVILTRSGAAQSVTRTVTATDGGAATATARGIDIDRVRPTVHVTGVRNGAVYPGTAPRAGCRAGDRISGVASCTLTRRISGGTTVITARATDRAGNSAVTRVRYRTLSRYVVGARYENGAFVVRAGRAYTLVVYSVRRPRYYDAVVSPQSPRRADSLFRHAGPRRWTLGVRIDAGMRSHLRWNAGIRIGAHLELLRLRVR